MHVNPHVLAVRRPLLVVTVIETTRTDPARVMIAMTTVETEMIMLVVTKMITYAGTGMSGTIGTLTMIHVVGETTASVMNDRLLDESESEDGIAGSHRTTVSAWRTAMGATNAERDAIGDLALWMKLRIGMTRRRRSQRGWRHTFLLHLEVGS